jgi:hypothetical protein
LLLVRIEIDTSNHVLFFLGLLSMLFFCLLEEMECFGRSFLHGLLGIRCRKTFKRSGTMQSEMEAGGSKLFFDLFVAMCNHLDDVIDVSNARTPKTV